MWKSVSVLKPNCPIVSRCIGGCCSKAHGMRVKLRLVAKLWFAPGVDEGGVQKEMKHCIKSNTFHALLPSRRHSDCHLSTRSFSSCWWSNYTTRLLELMICSKNISKCFFHTAKQNSRTMVCLKGSMRNLAEKEKPAFSILLQYTCNYIDRHFNRSIYKSHTISYIHTNLGTSHWINGHNIITSSLRSRNFWFNKNSFEARKNLGRP